MRTKSRKRALDLDESREEKTHYSHPPVESVWRAVKGVGDILNLWNSVGASGFNHGGTLRVGETCVVLEEVLGRYCGVVSDIAVLAHGRVFWITFDDNKYLERAV